MADDKKNMVVFSIDWLHELQNDEYDEYTPEEIAYLLYAAAIYSDRDNGEPGARIDIGEVFGSDYKHLNRTFGSYCGQIDRMKKYNPNNSETTSPTKVKFNEEAIFELASIGTTAKDICLKLGYGEERAKSLSTNKGWIRGRQVLKQKQAENEQKNTEKISVLDRF